MCVLMVCFNVLELLLDETAMPRGMEVRVLGTERHTTILNDLCKLIVFCVFVFL